MFIPESCIGFHVKWLSEASENEELEDLDMMEMAKAIVSVHHDFFVKNGEDPDGLMLLDQILDKLSHYHDGRKWVNMDPILKQQRNTQKEYAARLVREQKISILDAVCILFTKDELSIYGL